MFLRQVFLSHIFYSCLPNTLIWNCSC